LPSSVAEVLRATNAGTVVTFKDRTEGERMTGEIETKWFKSVRQPPTINESALKPYLANEMTRKLCAVFDVAASTKRGTTLANGSALPG